MTETIFFRLLADDGKSIALATAIDQLAQGEPASDVYLADPTSFEQIPGSPFAYWVSEDLRRKFTELPLFEGDGRTVKQGLATTDDFRFVRTWWEIPIGSRGGTCDETSNGKPWIPFAKGGEYSPYYADLHVVVNWGDEGEEIKANICRRYPYLNGNWGWVAKNADYYFRPGLTFPRRTKRFCPKALPAGAIFGHGGQTAFTETDTEELLGILGSTIIQFLVSLFLGTSPQDQGGTNPQFETGTIQRIPMASVAEQDGEKLSEIARKSVEVTRRADRANEFSHAFILPAVLWYEDATITDRIATWERSLSENRTLLVRNQGELDEITFRVYDISDEDRQAISATFGQTEPAPFIDDPIAQEVESDQELSETVVPAVIVADLVSYALGCTFGRWDIRIALDPLLAPELQGPFEPLPVCSPGILVGPDGLPATSGRIVSEAWLRARPNAITLPPEGAVAAPVISDRDYPLRVEWDGILVDDPDHADDLVRRVREVFDLLWGEQAEAIEREACQILGVRELRDYLCNPRRFFDAHLKRYSKSRRKAPIYWPLSTASGSYTLWLYYPRLTSDTLYTAVNRYVEPKQRDVARSLRDVETRLTDATGRAATDLRTERERLSDLSTELEEFRAELLRVAGLPYRPNLDDGVIINAAPLWGLFRHRAWARATHECWQKLEQGDYDWAHLAYEVWPERVREKCRTDRSLAIAHGLDGGGEARPREGAERTQVALSEESGG